MGTGRRAWALAVVVATIATAMGLVATPGLADPGDPAPPSAVEFVGAWTNDDGKVNDGDSGDTGFGSPAYDAWPLLPGPVSSSDPKAAGINPAREDKDVAICTAAVRSANAGYVDLAVQNAYPGYVCTFVTVVENGTTLPVTVAPAVATADSGLLVGTLSSLPDTLGPGEKAQAVFSVKVLQSALQSQTLGFSITIDLANPPCTGSVVFGVERTTGDLYEVDPVARKALLLADLADLAPGSINSPNGLAYDPATGRLYMSVNNVDSDNVASSALYFWDGVGVTYAGTVPGLPAGAEIAGGAYYYFINNTDDLYRVTFNANGTVAATALFAANVTGNTELLRFGDLVILGTTLYGSTNAPAENFFRITNLGGANTYTEISAPGGSRLQLAFGGNGVLYGASTATGEFFVVNPANGATTSLGVPMGASDGMTDLASGFCPPE